MISLSEVDTEREVRRKNNFEKEQFGEKTL